jgi:transcriptional regulator with XRE-family HTH domain
VDRVKIGNTFRAIRVELRLRQKDVAERAGVSQQTVSDLECGRMGGLSLDAYCAIARILDADVPLAPRWRGPKLDRLLDRRHALLQNRAAEGLASSGWKVRSEFSFSRYRDQGSVDVLGWRADCHALLIIEIKTEITDLQETLRILDMKRRVVPIVCQSEGWRPNLIGAVLVLPDASTHRDLIARHDALVSSALPARTLAVRSWVQRPSGDLRGVWFFRNTTQGGAMWRVQPTRRVRASSRETTKDLPRSPDPDSRSRRTLAVPGAASGTPSASRLGPK